MSRGLADRARGLQVWARGVRIGVPGRRYDAFEMSNASCSSSLPVRRAVRPAILFGFLGVDISRGMRVARGDCVNESGHPGRFRPSERLYPSKRSDRTELAATSPTATAGRIGFHRARVSGGGVTSWRCLSCRKWMAKKALTAGVGGVRIVSTHMATGEFRS